MGMGQPPSPLTVTSFPLSCDVARSASHMVLTKTGVKATMIPYSRSSSESSKDLRESSLSQKVRKPSELMMGGSVPEPRDVTHRYGGCRLRYLQSNLNPHCSRRVFPFKALYGPKGASLRPSICSLYMDCI